MCGSVCGSVCGSCHSGTCPAIDCTLPIARLIFLYLQGQQGLSHCINKLGFFCMRSSHFSDREDSDSGLTFRHRPSPASLHRGQG